MKYSRNTLVRLVVVMAALALVLSACGSSSKKSNNTKNPTSTGPTGSVVLGAEQWPSCVNPINQCANSSWLQWLVPIHVLPRLTELDEKNNFVASPLLSAAISTEDRSNSFRALFGFVCSWRRKAASLIARETTRFSASPMICSTSLRRSVDVSKDRRDWPKD